LLVKVDQESVISHSYILLCRANAQDQKRALTSAVQTAFNHVF